MLERSFNMSKEKGHEPFHFVEKNEIMDEPKDLYVLEYQFTMPITRDSYRKEKTESLHLDMVNTENEGLYPSDLNKCVVGAYVLEDFAKLADLKGQYGMKPGEQEIDVDNYTAEWSYNRPDSDSYYTRSFVQCEHAWDIDGTNPKELEENKIHFMVSIASETKASCYKEIKKLFAKTKEFAKDALVNEKDLVFEADIDKKFKQAELAIALEKKQTKLKPKQEEVRVDSLER